MGAGLQDAATRRSVMNHGSGWNGVGLMVLCFLPMVAIFLLLAFGLFR